MTRLMADRDIEAGIVSIFTTTQSVPDTLAIVPSLRPVIIYWYLEYERYQQFLVTLNLPLWVVLFNLLK